jgi:hypothetical protein
VQVKRYLREYRGHDTFRNEMVRGFQRVSRENVLGYYQHSILHFDEP